MPRPDNLPRPDKRGDEPMLSEKHARAAQALHNAEQNSHASMDPLSLIAKSSQGCELGREDAVKLVCVLLQHDLLERLEQYEGRIIGLLRRLIEDPDLTLLEQRTVLRALSDAGSRGKDKKFRRFWQKHAFKRTSRLTRDAPGH